MKKLLLMFLCALFFGVQLNAQTITVTIGTVTATSGTSVTIPVTLNGLNGTNSIAVGDLYIGYDTSKVSVTGGSFSGFSTLAPSADWQTNIAYSPGTMYLGWLSGSFDDVSFPNGTVMFNINVTYTGSTAAPITWKTGSYFEGALGFSPAITFVNGAINPTAPAPAVPTLSLPVDLATSIAINPTLTWNTAANATSYQVEVSTVNTFATTVVNQTVSTGTTLAVTGLLNSTQYFWRVKSLAGTLESAWSTVRSFTTVAAAPAGITVTIGTVTASSGNSVTIPVTLSGLNGTNSIAVGDLYIGYDTSKVSVTGGSFSNFSTLAPSADWQTNISYSPGTMYLGWLSGTFDDVSFPNGTVMFNINVTYTGSTAAAITWKAGSYFEGALGFSPAITWVNGGINPPATTGPAVPVLSLPIDLATGVAVAPTLSWNAATGATSYTIEVTTDNTFTTTPLISQVVSTGTSYAATGLANNTTYYWRVKSMDATTSSAWSTAWSFTTVMAPLAAPVLDLPADLATNLSLTPTLSWLAVATATGYNVEVSLENTFVTTFFSGSVTGMNKALTGLAYNTPYFWRVKATRGTDMSDWSTVRKFTTMMQPLTAPVLDMPADMATNVAIAPTISWLEVATATGYNVEVSTVNTFATTFFSGSVTGLNKALTGLAYNTPYFWRVKATRGTDMSDWSTVRSFTTMAAPAFLPPTLLLPANNASNISVTPTLSWAAADMATSYSVQVSTSSAFTSFVFDGIVSGLTKDLTGLANSTQYFWRVKSIKTGAESVWSSVWNFSTLSLVPPPSSVRFVSFSNVTTNSMDLAWINGNGDGRLVLAATENLSAANWTSLVNALNTNVATYSAANGNWANKVAVTAGGKTAYVVGKTTGTSRMLPVSGLDGTTMYYFFVVEYQYSPATYNSAAALLNPRSKETLQGVVAPVAKAATEVSLDMFYANWTLASSMVDFFEVELNGTIYDVGAASSGNGYMFPFLGTAGTTYSYRVRTVYNNTRSNWSDMKTVTTYSANTLSGPADACLDMPNVYTVNLTGATLNWSAQSAYEAYDWENSYTVSWITAGTFKVQVGIVDAAGNSGMLSKMVTVHSAPVVTAPASFAVCMNAANINLSTLQGASPAGGVFMGDGIVNNVFSPADAGVGAHTIYYFYQNPTTTCDNYAEFVITVKPVPTVTAPANMNVCADSPVFNLQGGMPTGGVYMMGTTAITSFNPAMYNAGVYTIDYVYTNDGCSNTASFTITINALPTVTVPANSTVCTATAPFALTGATPAGGVYMMGTNVVTNFNPATVGIGNHVITYKYTNALGCANTANFTITVTTAPNVVVPANSAVCIDANPFTLTGATPVGGVYKINNVVATSFNPATLGVGAHVVTYSYTAGDCMVSANYTITVNPLPTITVPTIAPVCILSNAFALTGATPVGGTYSGVGVVANMFSPAIAGVGTHTITYTFVTAGGCSNSAQFTINVTPATTITTQPTNKSGVAGDNIVYTVVAANATTYQWEVSVANAAYTAIPGATNATLTLNAVTVAMSGNKYRVVASGCGNVTSDAVTLTVLAPLAAPTVQAKNILWLNWGRTEITFSWINGNGTNRIVAMQEGTTWSGWTPTSHTNYVVGATPITGTTIIYNGTGSQVTASNLSRLTNYVFKVFEYNTATGQYLYLNDNNTNNPLSRSTSRKDEIFTPETRASDAPFELSTVSPNPASDNINFNVNVYETSNFRLELVNVLGEVVYSDNLSLEFGNYPMNISVANQSGRLSSGNYLLRLTSNGVSQTQNVVVIK